MDTLKGFNVPPIVVALVRGFIEAVVLAGLAWIGVNIEVIVELFPDSMQTTLNGIGLTETVLISGGIWAVRTLEGLADQKIDPNQNRDADVRAANP